MPATAVCSAIGRVGRGQPRSDWSILSMVGPQTFRFAPYSLARGATVSVQCGPDAPPTGGNVFRWTGSYIWSHNDDLAELRDPQGAVVDRRDC